MGTTKMGFEGLWYYGVAGATASTQMTNVVDGTYNRDVERGSTTTRGAGTSPPINTSRVTILNVTLEWTMLNKSNDATLAALLTAEATGAAVAIRTKDHAAGKGFDGDVTLSVRNGQPLRGEQTYVFSAEPTDDEGRTPQIYV